MMLTTSSGVMSMRKRRNGVAGDTRLLISDRQAKYDGDGSASGHTDYYFSELS